MKHKIERTNPRKRKNNWSSKQKQDSRKKHKSHKDSIQIQTLQKVGSFAKTLWNCFCSGFGFFVVFVDLGGCFVPFSCGALTTEGPTVLGGGEANDNN